MTKIQALYNTWIIKIAQWHSNLNQAVLIVQLQINLVWKESFKQTFRGRYI